MAAALKPHGCHASRAWFRVVRQLSVAGMQRRNRNRPFFSFFSSPPSTFFPLLLFLFWHAKSFFLPSSFLVPSLCFRRFIFNVIIIVVLFLDGPVLRGEPTLEGGVALMLDSGAERRTTRGGGRSRQAGEGYAACIAMHHPSLVREKAKATAGCVTFAALPMGAQKRPFHRRNTRNNTVETAVN